MVHDPVKPNLPHVKDYALRYRNHVFTLAGVPSNWNTGVGKGSSIAPLLDRNGEQIVQSAGPQTAPATRQQTVQPPSQRTLRPARQRTVHFVDDDEEDVAVAVASSARASMEQEWPSAPPDDMADEGIQGHEMGQIQGRQMGQLQGHQVGQPQGPRGAPQGGNDAEDDDDWEYAPNLPLRRLRGSSIAAWSSELEDSDRSPGITEMREMLAIATRETAEIERNRQARSQDAGADQSTRLRALVVSQEFQEWLTATHGEGYEVQDLLTALEDAPEVVLRLVEEYEEYRN